MVVTLTCHSYVYFVVTVGRLVKARKFNESFFNLGEPNLVLVPSGKIYLYSDITCHLIHAKKSGLL